VKWSLLTPFNVGYYRAFPVFISLEVEQPGSLEHLRYLLHVRLREAMDHWQKMPQAKHHGGYKRFQQKWPFEVTIDLKVLKLKLLQREHRLTHEDFRLALLRELKKLYTWQFEGICFLLDEVEFIVRQPWANDAWSYFRGLKDTDTALRSSLGLLLSGYRDVKEFQQRVGSPLLNIAELEWLSPLDESEARQLIARRTEDEQLPLCEEDIVAVIDWAGRHPFLTQQMLNVIFDARQADPLCAVAHLIPELLRQYRQNFIGWWNADQRSDGFGDVERAVYHMLVRRREGMAEILAQATGYNPLQVIDALDMLKGTGVVQQSNNRHYVIGTRLFEVWVTQQLSESMKEAPAN
jgi:hypothetical protein